MMHLRHSQDMHECPGDYILLVVLDADALEDFRVLAAAHLADDLVVVLRAEEDERRQGSLGVGVPPGKIERLIVVVLLGPVDVHIRIDAGAALQVATLLARRRLRLPGPLDAHRGLPGTGQTSELGSRPRHAPAHGTAQHPPPQWPTGLFLLRDIDAAGDGAAK